MTDRPLAELSKLPRDEAYWAGLEARMIDAVRTERLGETVGPELVLDEPWLVPLARGAWGLGVAAAAAAALLFVLPPRTTDAAPLPAPTSALTILIGADAPPSVADLLLPPSAAPQR